MSCDSEIHNELKEMGQLVCDFCDLKLVDDIIVKQEDPCCKKWVKQSKNQAVELTLALF